MTEYYYYNTFIGHCTFWCSTSSTSFWLIKTSDGTGSSSYDRNSLIKLADFSESLEQNVRKVVHACIINIIINVTILLFWEPLDLEIASGQLVYMSILSIIIQVLTSASKQRTPSLILKGTGVLQSSIYQFCDGNILWDSQIDLCCGMFIHVNIESGP